ncbi:hypothetical protein GN958_ATG01764 [Phytophthora infestans]|uniref:Uncharacterized protein n=1 Tax=Phytophthora infestans TaxID=4787 RepID=A0A8S9V7P2_PHYIN|nr:hypothetical protein GN958_ATG01764 [Phytophthora infestans]
MENAVLKQHAHPNTVLHSLYGYYNLGYSRKELARIYNKSEITLGNWIRVYESTGTFERAKTVADKKFSSDHREWLCDFFDKHPLAYLDEDQDAFMRFTARPFTRCPYFAQKLAEGGVGDRVAECRDAEPGGGVDRRTSAAVVTLEGVGRRGGAEIEEDGECSAGAGARAEGGAGCGVKYRAAACVVGRTSSA